MKHGRIKDATSGKVLLSEVQRAETFWESARGLLGRPMLESGQGFLLSPCRIIHTFGMRYALDLVYLDQHGLIVKLQKHLLPARLSGCLTARATLEINGGEAERLQLIPGRQLLWEEA